MGQEWRIFAQHPLAEGKGSSSQPEFVCWCWAQFSQPLSRWHPRPRDSCCSLGLGLQGCGCSPACLYSTCNQVCLFGLCSSLHSSSQFCVPEWQYLQGRPPTCPLHIFSTFYKLLFLNLCAIVAFAERSIYDSICICGEWVHHEILFGLVCLYIWHQVLDLMLCVFIGDFSITKTKLESLYVGVFLC